MTRKNLQIIFYKEANNDLEKIEEYIISKYDIYTARRIIEKIFDCINDIKLFPDSFQKVNNTYLTKYDVRKTRYKNYVVYFTKKQNVIHIIGIFHTKRLIKNIYDEIKWRM